MTGEFVVWKKYVRLQLYNAFYNRKYCNCGPSINYLVSIMTFCTEVCLSIGYASSAALVSKSIFPQIFFLQSANIAALDSINNAVSI